MNIYAPFSVRIQGQGLPVFLPAFSPRQASDTLTSIITAMNARGWYCLRCGEYQFVLLRRGAKLLVSIDAPSLCPN